MFFPALLFSLFVSELLTPGFELAAFQERVETRDTNKDGKPDVFIRVKDKKAVSSTVDRNRDGKPDLFRRYTPQGLPDSDEGDLDFDGRIDYWVWYTQGLKTSAAQDRNKDGEPDAWFFYESVSWRVTGGAVDEDFDGKYEKQWGSRSIEFPR